MSTWGQLRLILQQFAPGVSPDLVDQILNGRYQNILDFRAWKGIEAETTLQTVEAYQTGTVKLVQGSTSVVGTDTAWTSALNGLTFQVNSGGPLYTFTFVDATHGTLDRPFEGYSADASGYALLKNVYELPEDLKTLLEIRNAITGHELKEFSPEEAAYHLGFTSIAEPVGYILRSDTPQTPGPVKRRVELYPMSRWARGYPMRYVVEPSLFTGENTSAAPLPFVTDSCLLNGCKAELKALLNDAAGAQYYEARHQDDLNRMLRVDDSLQHNHPWRMNRAYTRHRLARYCR